MEGVVKAADTVNDGNSDVVAAGDTSEKAATDPSSVASKNIGTYLLMVVLVDVTSSSKQARHSSIL